MLHRKAAIYKYQMIYSIDCMYNRKSSDHPNGFHSWWNYLSRNSCSIQWSPTKYGLWRPICLAPSYIPDLIDRKNFLRSLPEGYRIAHHPVHSRHGICFGEGKPRTTELHHGLYKQSSVWFSNPTWTNLPIWLTLNG